MAEHDLMAELDDAERIMSGGVKKIVTEWGVREQGGRIVPYSEGDTFRDAARRRVERVPGDVVVKRRIIYGKWEDA